MAKFNILKDSKIYLFSALLSLTVPGLSQTTNPSREPIISNIVGDALPGTGMQQSAPRLTAISVVAPDVLCIEIDACRIIPCIQIPYQADPADVVTESGKTPLGEVRNMYVVRDGFPLGTLVGNDRKTITLYERIVGKNLDTEVADAAQNYTISSPGDNNYNKGIKPEKVWRKSKPTGWTDESWQLSKKQFSTSKHLVYLKLPYALKTGQSYLISLPALNLNRPGAYYVHDPAFSRSEAVHVSQIGFRADDPDKNAFLSQWMGNGGGYTYPENLEFSLISEKTNERVFTGKAVMQWKGNVPEGIGTKINHSGTDVIRLDFSSFNTPGRYRVCVEGIGCGYAFNIDEESTWKNAFELSLKGVFNHRNGIIMGPPYTDFVRPRSFHPMDGVKVYQSTCSLLNSGNGLNALGTDKNNFGNLVAGKTDVLVPEAWGGNMDAGDWDRRINHLLTPRLYLELVELNPEYFRNLNLQIPESKNDLPDLVDEAIYCLDIYRRMQMPDGGIRGGVESSEHPIEGGTSWQEIHTVMAYAPDHWSSYLYTGVASRLAVVLKMLGKAETAKIWEESAIKAMEYAEAEYQRWMASPDYAKVTQRAKNAIPTERNLAAVEIYRLTKNKKWHQVYLSTVKASRADAQFVYARIEPSLVDKKVQKAAVDSIMAEANRLVQLSANNAYGLTAGSAGRAMSGYSSVYVIPAATTLPKAHYLSGNPQYLKTILRSSLYSAGANPMNLSLTTGLGENFVQNPLHEDTKHTGRPAPLGITVFGPCELPFSDARPGGELETRLNTTCIPLISNWPASEAYFDVFWFVAQNEYVIDRPLGQAGYIWGYLASRK